jgi:hypothetical protein
MDFFCLKSGYKEFQTALDKYKSGSLLLALQKSKPPNEEVAHETNSPKRICWPQIDSFDVRIQKVSNVSLKQTSWRNLCA